MLNIRVWGYGTLGSQVCNSEDDEELPYFRYVTGYVMGGDVQQKLDPDAMVRDANTGSLRPVSTRASESEGIATLSSLS